MSELVLSERGSNVTLTRWLYEELRRAILEGRLPRRSPVPPTRSLAEAYSISRRIVVNVFDQLRDEGYLNARTGAGTVVSDSIPEDFLPQLRHPKPAAPRPRSSDHPDVYRRPLLPFRPIESALAEFPVDVWARVAGRVIRSASISLLAGGDTAGYRPLREAISGYLGSARGVACSPDQICITSGTQQSLDLVSRTVLSRGDRVWMEDPGYTDAAEAFLAARAGIVPISVDEHGIKFDRHRAPSTAKKKPRAVYLTPAHQFPLGSVLRLDRRLDLLQWTRQHDVAVFEDDYDSEFRFTGKPVPAMKGLAGAEHVFLLGTFNKSMFPALRIGYVLIPDDWIDKVLKTRRLIDRYPAGLPQAALAAFLSEGHYPKHLRRMRELYGARLGTLRAETKRLLGGLLELPEIQAGLNTPAFLLNGMTSQRAASLALEHDVECWPLDAFAFARKDLRGLVLGFAAFDERQIRDGVTRLARALQA